MANKESKSDNDKAAAKTDGWRSIGGTRDGKYDQEAQEQATTKPYKNPR